MTNRDVCECVCVSVSWLPCSDSVRWSCYSWGRSLYWCHSDRVHRLEIPTNPWDTGDQFYTHTHQQVESVWRQKAKDPVKNLFVFQRNHLSLRFLTNGNLTHELGMKRWKQKRETVSEIELRENTDTERCRERPERKRSEGVSEIRKDTREHTLQSWMVIINIQNMMNDI